MHALEISNISVSYNKQPVLEDISFTVAPGTLTGIIGPNGAGKSSLIKAILGLISKRSGEVKVYQKPLSKHKHLIGYVPQRNEVDWDFPINARDVVLMGRYRKIGFFKKSKKQDIEWADQCLAKVGMLDYAERQISQLSGGQQQRIFLARALAQDASIYLMDEPFAGVDAATEKAIIQLMKDWKANDKTVLVVHHDLQTVTDYFDHVLLLNKQCIQYGTTHHVFTHENLEKTFGGRVSFLNQATV